MAHRWKMEMKQTQGKQRRAEKIYVKYCLWNCFEWEKNERVKDRELEEIVLK